MSYGNTLHFRSFGLLSILLALFFSSCEYKYHDYIGERSTSFCVLNGTPFVGTMDGGVMMYSYSQKKWIQKNNGLDDDRIYCMAASGNTLFVGKRGGVFRSSDNGDHWEQVNPEAHSPTKMLAYENTVYVGNLGSGVFSSSDNGDTWTHVNESVDTDWTYAFAATDSGLYAGTGDGVYFSRYGGDEWVLDSGSVTGRIEAFLIVGNTMYSAGTEGIIYKSVKDSHYWEELSAMDNNTSINELYRHGNKIFAATEMGVYAFTDEDNSLVFSSDGLIDTVIPEPTDGIRYGFNWNSNAITSVHDSLLVATETKGVYLSVDDGNTWQPMNVGMITPKEIDWSRTLFKFSWILCVLFWLVIWVLPAKFLWPVPNGKRIYFLNFILGIVLTVLALLVFSTRRSGPWDFGNLERGLFILVLYVFWGIIFLIVSLVKRKRHRKNVPNGHI